MVALVILLAGGLVAIGLWSWLAPRAAAQPHNAWRRRRGRAEHTVEDVEILVAGQAQEIRRRYEPDAPE